MIIAEISKAKIFIMEIKKALACKNEVLMIILYIIFYNPLIYYAIIAIKLIRKIYFKFN